MRNRGFKHCGNNGQSGVLACGLREVRYAVEVWIVNSDLLELFGLMICVETGLGQLAQLPGARAEVRLSCALRTSKLGKDCADGKIEGDSSHGNSKDW